MKYFFTDRTEHSLVFTKALTTNNSGIYINIAASTKKVRFKTFESRIITLPLKSGSGVDI